MLHTGEADGQTYVPLVFDGRTLIGTVIYGEMTVTDSNKKNKLHLYRIRDIISIGRNISYYYQRLSEE